MGKREIQDSQGPCLSPNLAVHHTNERENERSRWINVGCQFDVEYIGLVMTKVEDGLYILTDRFCVTPP
jgi:hypothetical protein